jgi:hypothetical protein
MVYLIQNQVGILVVERLQEVLAIRRLHKLSFSLYLFLKLIKKRSEQSTERFGFYLIKNYFKIIL